MYIERGWIQGHCDGADGPLTVPIPSQPARVLHQRARDARVYTPDRRGAPLHPQEGPHAQRHETRERFDEEKPHNREMDP